VIIACLTISLKEAKAKAKERRKVTRERRKRRSRGVRGKSSTNQRISTFPTPS
jgi:hypothetical protein